MILNEESAAVKGGDVSGQGGDVSGQGGGT